VLEGRPVAVFALLDITTRIAADEVLTPGEHVLELHYVAANATVPAHAEIRVDDVTLVREPVPGLMFLPNLSSAAAGLPVGRDRGFALSRDYTPPFAFTGTLRRVALSSGGSAEHDDTVARLTAAVAGD